MDVGFLEEISVGDGIYVGASIVAGLVLALVARLLMGRLKSRLRQNHRVAITAELMDDVDGALSLWIVLIGVYVALLGLPPLGEHLSAVRQGFLVVSTALVVFAGIRVQAELIDWAATRVGRGTGRTKVVDSLAPFARQVASMAILSMGVLVVLDQLGISIAPLVAGLGIGGLAVALALQGTLTNLFAGLNIMTDGSIRVGDYVELEGGLVGAVDQIGWRSTRVRLLSDNMVMIPNALLATRMSTNFNWPSEEMSVYLKVGVSYFSDLAHVERVTVEVARQVLADTPGAVANYEPSIWYTDFGDSNINFWAVLRAHSYLDSWLVKHRFIKALFSRYEEEGIEISFPNRNVFIRDGSLKPPLAEPPQDGTPATPSA